MSESKELAALTVSSSHPVAAMEHYSRAARMARFSSANRSQDGPAIEGGVFAYLDSRRTPEVAQMALKLGPDSSLVSLPMELVEMIIGLVAEDEKSLPSVRLVCKLFKNLSKEYFHCAFLTHLHVAPTRRAFGRLLSTARNPELSTSVQAITVLYDNENFADSGALCSGMHERGKVDFFLETLEYFHRIGKEVDLNVTVANPPLDAGSSVIRILYRVLGYVLYGYPVYGPPGVRTITMHIDDTSSAAYPILTDPSEARELAVCYSAAFQDIWVRMAEIQALLEVKVRFSKKGEETQPPRELIIQHKEGFMHIGMRNLATWHIDIMGRMNVFYDVYLFDIQNCELDIRRVWDWFPSHSRMQHLVLRNVGLHDIRRHFNPPRLFANREVWNDFMNNLAGSTNLQSFWAEHLIDHDGSILYTEPWHIQATSNASVSDGIWAQWP
ncbi:hypothetical protein KCU85_g6882, partial [Aureobasidium melanogenum]